MILIVVCVQTNFYLEYEGGAETQPLQPPDCQACAEDSEENGGEGGESRPAVAHCATCALYMCKICSRCHKKTNREHIVTKPLLATGMCVYVCAFFWNVLCNKIYGDLYGNIQYLV